MCENERLRLMCKNETVIAIYSASFGHLLHGSPHCPQEPGSKADMGLQQQGAQVPSSGKKVELKSCIDMMENYYCTVFNHSYK